MNLILLFLIPLLIFGFVFDQNYQRKSKWSFFFFISVFLMLTNFKLDGGNFLVFTGFIYFFWYQARNLKFKREHFFQKVRFRPLGFLSFLIVTFFFLTETQNFLGFEESKANIDLQIWNHRSLFWLVFILFFSNGIRFFGNNRIEGQR